MIKVFSEFCFFQDLLTSDDHLIVNEMVVQRDGIVRGVELDVSGVWNGQTIVDLSSEKYDTKQVLSMEKQLKSSDSSLTFVGVFNGANLYHHSKASLGQFEVSSYNVDQSNLMYRIMLCFIRPQEK